MSISGYQGKVDKVGVVQPDTDWTACSSAVTAGKPGWCEASKSSHPVI